MKWILTRDYEMVIRNEVRQVVMGNKEVVIDDHIASAIELVSGYLRSRYDLVKVFYDIPQFNASDVGSYTEGDVIRSNTDVLYTVNTDSPGTDLNDEDDYTKGDPRNKQLVKVVVDIAMYELHSRISPRNIPDLRLKRFEDAMRWLRDVQKEMIVPDLPLIEDITSQTYGLSEGNKTAERW